MTEGTAYARAGLLGNPSDGYNGKIIAVSVRDFSARVRLDDGPRLSFEAPSGDEESYGGLEDFAGRVSLYGYYGGLRLMKAALKVFLDHCRGRGIALPPRLPVFSWESRIPRQVGLGGSSALITAAFRALMFFYGVEIPRELQPSLILAAEREELDINAGFMDRVVQVYEGCVYMDLDAELLRRDGHGRYEPLDPALLPPLYLAFKPSLGKVSGRVLNDIRVRFDRGDPFVIGTLKKLAVLAERGREALVSGDRDLFSRLMDENFELRRSIQFISPANLEMIEAARALGASAKYAGSGGSIIGSYRDETMYAALAERLGKLGATVLKPAVTA